MSGRLFYGLMNVVTGSLAGFLLAGGNASPAQQRVSSYQAAGTARVTLAEAVRNLPAYVQAETQTAHLGVIENATMAERDSALPTLMQWLGDERARVRGLVLLSLYSFFMPSETRAGPVYGASLPVQYVPAVAAHLRDPDPIVRNRAFLALQSVEYSGVGMDELTKLVVPMLREPDVVTEYPDPFFIESNKRMLAGMTPQQQAQFKAQPHSIIRQPAEGAGLIGILTMQRGQPSAAVDDAIIAFLDREDQTKSTLGACLHSLALSSASERVNDEALRRVFEQKAMTIFLLQFVSAMRLNPVQLNVQKERLVALSNDESARPALRRAARDVAACWSGERNRPCAPNSRDLSEQVDDR